VRALTAGLILTLAGCSGCRSSLVSLFSPAYEAPQVDSSSQATPQLQIELSEVLSGFAQPTDMQFLPGSSQQGLVLEKGGGVHHFHLEQRQSKRIHQFKVLTDSELGLLGLAFHPRFPKDPRIFLNRTIEVQSKAKGSATTTRIASFVLDAELKSLSGEVVLLEVAQPYPNHNAGQLSFGPDGYLYIGFGDGGWRDDPAKHGQNLGTLLGSIVRIDVNDVPAGKVYGVPKSNPFVGQPGALPEAYVLGVRNPWRFSFSPAGELIVADVGQNTFEEVSIARAGANLGWSRTEANSCFVKHGPCSLSDYQGAFVQYGRDEGKSITGGYVYRGAKIPALKGLYVFADFVTGRIWSAPLPSTKSPVSPHRQLGQFERLISSFGQADDGTLYVLDFAQGAALKIVASSPN